MPPAAVLLLLAVTALCGAAYLPMSWSLTHCSGTPVVVTAGIGIVPALPFVLPVLALTAPATVPGARVVGSLLLLGTFGIAVALVAFYGLQRRVGPVRALLVSYLNPIVAVLLGVALLGESFSVATAAGMALIVAGVVLATRPDTRYAAPIPVVPVGPRAGRLTPA